MFDRVAVCARVCVCVQYLELRICCADGVMHCAEPDSSQTDSAEQADEDDDDDADDGGGGGDDVLSNVTRAFRTFAALSPVVAIPALSADDLLKY